MVRARGRSPLQARVRASRRTDGSFVFVPRGTPHCFQNVGSDPARILVIFTPAGMERFFDQFAQLQAPDQDEFLRIGEPLGMRVIGPPLAQSNPL